MKNTIIQVHESMSNCQIENDGKVFVPSFSLSWPSLLQQLGTYIIFCLIIIFYDSTHRKQMRHSAFMKILLSFVNIINKNFTMNK